MIFRIALVLLGSAAIVFGADTAATTRVVPRMPPPGIAIPDRIRTELIVGTAALGKQIEDLRAALAGKEDLLAYLPDVQIFYNAVHYALEDGIFYKTNDFATAKKLLAEGAERAEQLREGKTPWDKATGLVVRGYLSEIDGSVQPYGLVVPESFHGGLDHNFRLDFWYHGRNANLSELAFLADRERNPGEFTPADTFVLHPYGRYCNANKFAGETDSFEALANVKRHYPIDENRIAVRGFSMGGAATWHMAAQHAGLWAAANPGAGFVDTAIFQKIFRRTGKPAPPWYVQELWHLYDTVDYAANLYNCPVVAYSGEIDGQKEAADLMAAAMANEGMELVHIIGPNTAHKYEPHAKAEVAKRMDALMEKGRDPMPRQVRFTTWTLRFNKMRWITVDGMEEHWKRARVDGNIYAADALKVTTTNVSMLTLSMPAGLCPLDPAGTPTVTLDNQIFVGPPIAVDHSWTAHFRKVAGRWAPSGDPATDGELRKRHGLQGPIDDAFMDSFIIVEPTGSPLNQKVDSWVRAEMKESIRQWRLQFRGEPRAKYDREITDEDIASSNLVLWGDPRSNKVLGRIMDKLPIRWSRWGLKAGDKSYSSKSNVPVLIFPNPLNPKHYVVVNSGFTFADEAPTSNALQVPKLPDFAIRDLDNDGAVVQAGFFDEQWKMPIIQ